MAGRIDINKTGEFVLDCYKTNGDKVSSFYLKLNKGVIIDCAGELRDSYEGIHVSYLIKWLQDNHGPVDMLPLKRVHIEQE